MGPSGLLSVNTIPKNLRMDFSEILLENICLSAPVTVVLSAPYKCSYLLTSADELRNG